MAHGSGVYSSDVLERLLGNFVHGPAVIFAWEQVAE
jgi:hypothetical protein